MCNLPGVQALLKADVSHFAALEHSAMFTGILPFNDFTDAFAADQSGKGLWNCFIIIPRR